MAFNHYAKVKRSLDNQLPGWYILLIDELTVMQNFKGEKVAYDHHYGVYDETDSPIKYCKLQKIDKLASVLGRRVEELPVVSD